MIMEARAIAVFAMINSKESSTLESRFQGCRANEPISPSAIHSGQLDTEIGLQTFLTQQMDRLGAKL